jgi:hypothetical protein
MILAREFGFKRRSKLWLPWLPWQLSDAQKKSRVEFSRDFLQILEDYRDLQFDKTTIEDEFWFQNLIQCDSMFASSRDAVTRRIRPHISTKETRLAIFFASHKLLVLDALPKGQKSHQNYFVQTVIPELQSERSRFARRKARSNLPRRWPIQCTTMARK